MIISPFFSNYKQSESLQYLYDVEMLCKQNNPEPIASPLQQLETSNKALSKAYKQDQGSSLTQQIITYDQRRDNAVICLRTLAQAYTYHFDRDKQEAAELILRTIDKYGNSLHRLNYQAETSILTNLYTDLQTAELQAALALLNMTDLVEEMNSSNTLFNETYLSRVQESAAQEQPTTGLLLKEAIAHYRALISYIEAYNIIHPGDEYTLLLKQINELTNKYNSMVLARSSKPEEEIEA